MPVRRRSARQYARGLVGWARPLSTRSHLGEIYEPRLDEIYEKHRIEMRTEGIGVHRSFSIFFGLPVETQNVSFFRDGGSTGDLFAPSNNLV